ncbi:hypothetical protein [Arthrobacter mobilis]|uniref:Lipoprotein n=1 Tax=Arthrobacter mobilis TaxID=2724944 RepID=A0A7X6HHI8_9MICC|nr:hypothetical protein [Arthrobacter mobilis]NKX56283.1 hypothetical protein [Arthrobacter mobilis]
MKKSLLLSAALVVGLTGCGSGSAGEGAVPAATENPAAAPASSAPAALPAAFGPGEYYFEYKGATGRITLPSKPDAEIEEIRDMAGAGPVTYATVKVDNRKGTEHINMYEISVYSPEGEKFTFSGAASALDNWEIDSEVVGTDAYNRKVDVYNKHIEGADPLQVQDFVMVGQFAELPKEFTGMNVMPTGGFDSVLAVPEELKDQYAQMTQDVAQHLDAPPMD